MQAKYLMKRLVILDPCLTIVSSHNYSEACALVRESRQLQLPLKIYCHQQASQAVRQLPAQPFFRQSGYSHILEVKPSADFLAAAFCNQATLQDLSRLTAELKADDFVFFPTVTGNIVLAVCQWLATFPPERAPGVGMCLMFPPDANAVGTPSPIVRDYYERAFALLPPAVRDRIVYTCETDALSLVYEPLVGTRPVTLALPTWTASPPRTQSRRETMRIAFLGDGRIEKGFALLPEIVSAVRSDRPEVSFTVQAVGNDRALVGRVADQLSTHGDAVTLIRAPLSDEQLFAIMHSSDILLLPYDASKYRLRGSSLFTEAKAIGIPMILPDATAFGEEARRKNLAELFYSFTAEGVAAAAVRAIDRWEHLSHAARREAQNVRRRHSGYLAVMLRSLRAAA